MGATWTLRARRLAPDALAFAFLLAVALAWCGPALVHGTVFGSYDLALSAGVGKSLVTGVHDLVNGDQARQDAAWMHLNWVAVHHGSLPLWNPFNELGLPELANFQSSAASLPSLIAYLAPLSAAYTVSVVAKLVIGGLGCYVAARVLGTGRSAALLAGVVGEVGGPMAAWAGWPQTGVAEWTGWVVALVVLGCRRPSTRVAAALAVVVAFACAGGFPEVLALIAIAALVLGVVELVGLALARRRRGEGVLAGVIGPIATLGSGAIGGLLLAAPVLLPALPALHRSVTSLRPREAVLGASTLALLFDPSYYGLPSTNSLYFGSGSGGVYFETACFVGPLVLCCALVALCRRPTASVIGIAAALVVVGCLAFGVPPIYTVALQFHDLATVAFGRGLLVVCDLLGILAAVGVAELARRRPGVIGWGALALLAVGTTVLAVVGSNDDALSAAARRIRLDGFVLAGSALLVLALAMLVGPIMLSRTSPGRAETPASRFLARCAGSGPTVAIVIAEAVTLVLASFTVSTWSSTYLPSDPALASYLATTSGGLVALGGDHPPFQPPRLGIYPELNAAYGVRELAGYDAVTPEALERLWATMAPAPDLANVELAGDITQFAPAITTASEARRLGVSYLIEPLHNPARLVDDPQRCVAEALAPAGPVSPAETTGMLDDLEWLVEEPAVLRRFPVRHHDAIARYLTTVAGAPSTIALPPTADGPPAAAQAVADAHRLPAIFTGLQRCLTFAPDAGLTRVATVGSEVLYRLSGPSGAYFSRGDGSLDDSLRYVGDARATVTVSARRASWLTVTIDDEPGWSAATAAGERLETRDADGLVTVRVPAGRSVVILRYWPKDLTLGLVCAAIGFAGVVLVAFGLPLRLRRRHRVSEWEPPRHRREVRTVER